MAKLKLLSDRALREAGFKRSDGLGFEDYAETLSHAVQETDGPFTIGIFGEWGTGKTSLMHLVEERVKDSIKEKKIDATVIWFDAWRFAREEHPLVPLVMTVIRGLEGKKRFEALVKTLRAFVYGVSLQGKAKLPGLDLGMSISAKDAVERYEKLSRDPWSEKSLYIDAFARLSEIQAEAKGEHKVVVIIDDLDRCLPDSALKLLEGIKLVLSQPGFVFILGVAEKVIRGYLKHLYKKEYGIEDFDGGSYIDKMIQLRFPIPSHTGRGQELAKVLCAELGEGLEEEARKTQEPQEDKAFQRVLRELKEIQEDILPVASGDNPRSMVRLVNNLLIDGSLSAKKEKDEKKKWQKVHMGVFAVYRGLQMRWPDMSKSLTRRDHELCSQIAQLNDVDELKTLVEKKATSPTHQRRIDAARDLLEHEQLRTLLFSKYGKSWLTDEKIRTQTTQFLLSERKGSLGADEPDEPEEPVEEFDLALVYRDEDWQAADEIEAFLLRRSVTCSKLLASDREGMESTMAAAWAIGFLISSGAHKSQPLAQAVDHARALRQSHLSKLIVPILLPGAKEKPDSPANLRRYNGVELQEGPPFDKGLEPLVEALKPDPGRKDGGQSTVPG